jgi:hypothetical protein
VETPAQVADAARPVRKFYQNNKKCTHVIHVRALATEIKKATRVQYNHQLSARVEMNSFNEFLRSDERRGRRRFYYLLW